ncbi:phosphatases II [Sparassis crispa]|uniref:protein-tyrosine-phosphatase n=1 Tax=Sparassis crispa TaxID=139825 RepID=A0A401GI25_9APHY|nr:phosphatases II [Sparassis crispa]GBE81819.1 phosphatases II [Sparassis crispa]
MKLISPAPLSFSPSLSSASSWHTAQSAFPGSPTSASGSSTTFAPTEILPRLFISDLGAAESATTLTSLGITHVVSAMCGRVLVPSGMPLKHLQLPIHDNPFAELAQLLPAATSFVSDALRDPNARVLVHCVQGVSRSSSVVCAFLIAHYGWSPDRALQFVRSKWSRADPNPGFVGQLSEYAESLRAPARQ